MGIISVSPSQLIAPLLSPLATQWHALASWLGLSRYHAERDVASRRQSCHAAQIDSAGIRITLPARASQRTGRRPSSFNAGGVNCASYTLNPAHAGRLKVVRESDNSGYGDAGRMIISGRMADVCDELDRLADSEQKM